MTATSRHDRTATAMTHGRHAVDVGAELANSPLFDLRTLSAELTGGPTALLGSLGVGYRLTL